MNQHPAPPSFSDSNPPAARASFSLWPYAIIAWFVFFGGSAAAFVAFALRHPMDLVRPDYYEQELRYQDQIEREQRTARLGRPVRIAYDPAMRRLHLQLPAPAGATAATGVIHCYRPANAAEDRRVELQLDSRGRQWIDVSTMSGGLWRIRLHWVMDGEEFSWEESVVLTPASGRL
jgi:hypothetical protein